MDSPVIPLSLISLRPKRSIVLRFCLGYKQVIPVLEEAGRRGIRGAWAFASGFAETGGEGVKLQEDLRKVCLDYGIHFCGPNCVGYANLQDQVGTYSAPISPTLKKGKVSVIAQSGSVLLAIANSNRGIGFNLLISSGNEAVLDSSDYMAYLVEDKNTDVIIAFLESIRRPDEFIRCCERAAELEKPIIALKVGRSRMAQKVAQTHTGALTGSDGIQDALFKKLGVIRVDDLDQLLETAEALVRCRGRWPKGGRIGAITVSGGEISLIGDLAEGLSISFPPLSEDAKKELRRRLPPFTSIGNPLDGWGSGDLVETYPACLEVLAKRGGNRSDRGVTGLSPRDGRETGGAICRCRQGCCSCSGRGKTRGRLQSSLRRSGSDDQRDSGSRQYSIPSGDEGKLACHSPSGQVRGVFERKKRRNNGESEVRMDDLRSMWKS